MVIQWCKFFGLISDPFGGMIQVTQLTWKRRDAFHSPPCPRNKITWAGYVNYVDYVNYVNYLNYLIYVNYVNYVNYDHVELPEFLNVFDAWGFALVTTTVGASWHFPVATAVFKHGAPWMVPWAAGRWTEVSIDTQELVYEWKIHIENGWFGTPILGNLHICISISISLYIYILTYIYI